MIKRRLQGLPGTMARDQYRGINLVALYVRGYICAFICADAAESNVAGSGMRESLSKGKREGGREIV